MDRRKKAKIIAMVLCVVVLAGTVLNQTGVLKNLMASADVWSGEMPAANGNYAFGRVNGVAGAGTEARPYYIVSGEDLAQLVSNLNSGAYGTRKIWFELMNDINLNDEEWTAIGTGKYPFMGGFDGNGYTISGLKLTLGAGKTTNQGLFGYVEDATICDLNVRGRITQGTQTGVHVGGIVGTCSKATIKDCTYTGNVEGNVNVGGIVGTCSGKSGSAIINGCSVRKSTGSLVSGTSKAVGGVVGYLNSGAIVINCSNEADVKLVSGEDTADASVGGLVGYIDNSSLVNSYNAGTVNGSECQYASGIASGNIPTMMNCYNRGMVAGSASGRAGSISGYIYDGILDGLYYVSGTCDEAIAGSDLGNTFIDNIGSMTAYDKKLVKSSIITDDAWTMEGKKLKEALGSLMGSVLEEDDLDQFNMICEWDDDNEYVNDGYPVLTKTVGHICDIKGSTTIKKEATCTTKGQAVYTCSICGASKTGEIKALGHDFETKITAPTCTATGQSVQVCKRDGCTATGLKNEIKALGHDMQPYTLDPTCTAEGYTTERCARGGCGYEDDSLTVTTAALGHSETKEQIKATCTSDEYYLYTCSTCKNVRREVVSGSALGHAWSAPEYRKPNCQSEGGMVKTCYRCSREEFDGVPEPKTAHEYKVKEVIAPTCEAQGKTIYECSVCAVTYDDDFKSPTGHKFYKDEVKAPTCKEEGYTLYKCEHDGCTAEKKEDKVKTIAHSWIEKEAVAPTCTKSGYIKSACELCGDEKTERLDALGGHKYVTNEAVSVEPSCVSEGAVMHMCQGCGDIKKVASIPKLGHKYEDKIIKPTCLLNGYTLHKCIRCEESTKDTLVPPLGHKFKETVFPATTTTMGYTLIACVHEGCDNARESAFIAATPDASFDPLTWVLTLSKDGMGELMKYSIDNGVTWITKEAVSVQLSEADFVSADGVHIQVVRPGNDVKPLSDSAVQYIDFAREMFSGTITVDLSTENGLGTISNVDDTMEWRAEEDTTWTAVPEGETTIEGLTPGVYYVRVKATASALPSADVMVVIEDEQKPSENPDSSSEPEESKEPVTSEQPDTSSEPEESKVPETSTEPKESFAPDESTVPVKSTAPDSDDNSGNGSGSGFGNGSSNGSGNGTGTMGNGNNSSNGSQSNNAGSSSAGSTNNSGSSLTGSANNSGSSLTGSTNGTGNGTANKKGTGTSSDKGVLKNDVLYYNSKVSTSSGIGKTGDETGLSVWIMLAGVSVTAFAAAKVKRQKKVEK